MNLICMFLRKTAVISLSLNWPKVSVLNDLASTVESTHYLSMLVLQLTSKPQAKLE